MGCSSSINPSTWLGLLVMLHGLGCGEASDAPYVLPVSDEEARFAAELSPTELPRQADPTNRFADSPEAAAFGQALFFDPRFSGPLLETDNNPDANPGSLGYVGEAGKVACAGCHIAADDFVDTRTTGGQISLASAWVMRRTPTLLDAAQSPLLMWDGRFDTAFGQVFGALESHREMNTGRLFVAQELFRAYRAPYEALFGPMPPLDDVTRFPQLAAQDSGCTKVDYYDTQEPTSCRGMPGDAADFDGLSAADRHLVTEVVTSFGKAIGAYVRLLSCGRSRFDEWVHGDAAALSENEIRGFQLFVGKAGCVGCHSGPYFTDHAFHNVGLQPKTVSAVLIDLDDPGAHAGLAELQASELSSVGPYSDGDDGRMPESIAPSLLGAFKTPSLRCVAGRPSYMHTAQLKTLEQVVSFFDAGGDRYGFLGTSELQHAPGERTALGLTDDEKASLVDFLEALEGPGPAAHLRQSN